MNAIKKVSHEKHGGQVLEVPLSLIDIEAQVRTTFNEQTIAELAADIRENNLLQPLVVRPNGNRFRLLIGERRLRALRMIGAETAPAIIARVPDSLAQHVQLMENIQREDLNAKDLAAAIKTIWDKLGSSAAVAKAVHKSPSWVSKRLSLALSAGVSTTALLDGNVKDVELLYQFAKLEKINPTAAANLVPHILMGTIGREQVVDHLVGLDGDGKLDLEKMQQSVKETPVDGIGAAPIETPAEPETPIEPRIVAEHEIMLVTLRNIMAVPKNLSPLKKAEEMRLLARQALQTLGELDQDETEHSE